MEPIDEDSTEEKPSKSARKRAALSLQKLGAQLVDMRATEVAALPLSDALQEAIAEARRLKSHGARARQMQYIGKLMRTIDLAALEAALERLALAKKPRFVARDRL
jgi:ribosome-associated protein